MARKSSPETNSTADLPSFHFPGSQFPQLVQVSGITPSGLGCRVGRPTKREVPHSPVPKLSVAAGWDTGNGTGVEKLRLCAALFVGIYGFV